MAENVGSVEINVDVDTRTMSSQIQRAADRAARVYGQRFSKTAGGELNSLFTTAGARMRTEAAKAGELTGEGFADHMRESIVQRVRRWDLDISKGVVFGDWKDAVSTFDDVDDAVKRITARMEHLRKEGELTGPQYESAAKSLDTWVRKVRELNAEQAKAARTTKAQADARDEERKTIEKLAKVIKDQQVNQRKLTVEEDRSGRGLARLKGARNDFVNLIGVAAQGFENLIQSTVRGGVAIGNFIGDFREVTKGMSLMQKAAYGARGGITALTKSFGSIPFATIATGFASMLVTLYSFAGVGKLITTLAAGLSSLTAIVVALAASIGSALAGALLSLGPILGSVAAAAGAVTIAVTQNKDAFKAAIGPLQDWVKEAGKAAGKAILPAITSAAKDLGDTLDKYVTPMLVDSAKAVGDFAKDFAASLGSSRMQKNLKVFRDEWPEIFTNLGRIVTSAFEGISGVIAAISPSVTDITDEIADAFENFAEWSNEADNQTAIKDWFEGAWESAKKLFDIIGNVATAISNIFGLGKDTGDGFLSSLQDITQEFENFTKDPEGREQIRQWFEDAKDVASDLWEVVKSVGEAFDDWDTSETREDFETLLDAITLVIGGLSGFVKFLNGLWDTITFAEENPIQDWFDNTVTPWWDQTALPWLKSLPGQMWNAITTSGDFLSGGPLIDWWENTVVPWWDETALPAAKQWGGDLIDGFVEGVDNATATLGQWWSDTWTGFIQGVKDIFGISSPSTVFAQIGTDIINGLIQGLGQAWQNVVNWWTGTAVPWFSSLPTVVGGWFSNMWSTMSQGIATGWTKVQTWWTGTALPWFQSLPGKVGAWFSKMWGKFTQGIGAGWAKVTKWWSGTAVPWFQSLPGKVATWFSNMWSRWTSGLSAGWAKVTKWWSSTAVPWFKSLPGKVATWFSNMWSKWTSGLSAGWGKVKTWWSNTAVPWFKDLPNKVAGYFEDMWNEMVDAAKALPGKIETWWDNDGWPTIKSVFTDADWSGIGGDIIEGIINGITGGDLGSVLRNKVNSAVEDAKDALGINSPSKVTMREIGMPIGQGIALGVERSGRLVDNAMSGLVSRATPAGNRNPAVSGFDGATNATGGRDRAVLLQTGAIQIVTPTRDPVQVAQMTVDRLVRSTVG